MTSEPVLIRRIEHLLDLLRQACLAAASVALVTLIVTFGWLVFGRYVLNATPTWVEQLALLLICYIAFLGAAAGVRDDTHIGVNLFRDMMPPVVQKLLMILIDIALGVFGAVMLFAGLTLMSFGWDTLLPMLNIPETVRTAAITSLGGLMMLFAGTRALLRIVRFSAWTPNSENEEF
ncbi:TRAP transporter small permease [Tritonibacter horizontis]|uniref:TRAP transporter small permease protein n=1 Tax=Tritonibacter horizontis TaxID=1768241 RepID=A0A132BST3_9RHOB|nr:TRAP transporter small permease [Tritonibacter horizontis]KUP90810.1 tripartite ATP-independent periplasmic transporter, DctQ component [Tritonibacter horizontis]